jgi:membrane protease YdiL (CAAX protease family)
MFIASHRVPPRDPLRPLLGAATCALLYWVTFNLLIPPVRFIGGPLVAVTVTTLIAGMLASALAMAIFESRKLLDLGLHGNPSAAHNLALGTALGAGGALLAVGPPILIGFAHFAPVPDAEISLGAVLFTPILLFCGAAGEEIAFRGFAQQYLMRGYGAWAAILGMSALFGLLHAANPGATPLSVINTTGFGILFGAALLRSHDLWLPIGMHFGWNATLPFLGVGLSGLTIRVTRYELVWQPGGHFGQLWSGGAYGPEASLLASGVLILLFAVVWKMPVRKSWAYLLDGGPEESPPAL